MSKVCEGNFGSVCARPNSVPWQTQSQLHLTPACSQVSDVCVQGGISTADRIVTVSPGYAWEIQTPEGGWGMESMLTSRAYALNGVLNGIDTQEWNPSTDKHIAKNYSVSNFSRGKVGLK